MVKTFESAREFSRHIILIATLPVDVLQRAGQHPASRVHELTPRIWKSLFAGNPLRAPLHQGV
ncbi:hypothetical protein AB4Y38_42430 [Paraburkholderia sp. EG285A]|uniref:hypothetical protein n=1 Tax=Paraburkholderia sp. EG285A TaxID=3237009 RepID=UPI0034D30206